MMMDIFKRIKAFHPSLTDEDFIPTSVQQTRKAVSSQMNQVKSFNRNQFSLFNNRGNQVIRDTQLL